MRAIFISYRREDTEGHAGRLFEDLRDRFGKEAVFMDVAGIEPGRDFRRVIEQQVASCGVLLAMIGKNWLSVVDKDGKRRLDDPYDFVRLETASALKRDIPVVPVLVHDATMPRAEQLPDDLKELAFRNSVELTHARWGSDVQLLINALLPYVDATPPAPPPTDEHRRSRAAWVIAPLAAVAVAVGGVGYGAWEQLRGPHGSSPAAAPAPQLAASAPPVLAAAAASVASAAPATAPPVATSPASAGAPLAAASSSPPAATIKVDKPVAVKPAPAPKPVAIAVAPAPSPAVAPSPAPAAAPPPSAPASIATAPPSSTPELLATRDPGTDLYGGPGTLSMVTRTIVIRPDASYVNVTGGEVIRFQVGNKSFVWAFNGPRSSFDLGLIAPPNLLGRKVMAYVAPDPAKPRRS